MCDNGSASAHNELKAPDAMPAIAANLTQSKETREPAWSEIDVFVDDSSIREELLRLRKELTGEVVQENPPPGPQAFQPLAAELRQCMERYQEELLAILSREVLDREGAGRNFENKLPPEAAMQGLGSDAAATGALNMAVARPSGEVLETIQDQSSRWDIIQNKNTTARHPSSTHLSMRSQERTHGCKFARVLVEHKWFDRFFILLITLSAVCAAAEVEYAARTHSEEYPLMFAVLQWIFCIAFSLELILRLAASKSVRAFYSGFDKSWNIFDTGIVVAAIMELCLAHVLPREGSVLQAVRLVRLVRIVRIIRVVRFLRQLRVMIYTVLNTLPDLFWSMLLILIVVAIFATAFTMAVTEHVVASKQAPKNLDKLLYRFGTIEASSLSLFLSITNGIGWDEFVHLFFEISWIYTTLYIVFICGMQFAMLNVITGFFCENAFDMISQDKEEAVFQVLMNKDAYRREFKAIFDLVDKNHSGYISMIELEDCLEDESVLAFLAHLTIPVSNACKIFRLLDKDSSGHISIDEFVEGLLTLKGQSMTADIAALHYDLQDLIKTSSEFMKFVEDEFSTSRCHFERRLAEIGKTKLTTSAAR